MMGTFDNSWISMKKFLGGRSVISQIVNFDARDITSEMSHDVENLIKEKQASFEEKTIRHISMAAYPLAIWVKATLKYSQILRKIKPLEDDLAKTTKKLEIGQSRISESEKELTEIDKKISTYKEVFGKKTSEAKSLEIKLVEAKATLKRAQSLLGKLSGEKLRWDGQVSELN